MDPRVSIIYMHGLKCTKLSILHTPGPTATELWSNFNPFDLFSTCNFLDLIWFKLVQICINISCFNPPQMFGVTYTCTLYNYISHFVMIMCDSPMRKLAHLAQCILLCSIWHYAQFKLIIKDIMQDFLWPIIYPQAM